MRLYLGFSRRLTLFHNQRKSQEEFPKGRHEPSKEVAMKTSDQIRIMIVDDHPLLHEGLASIIQCQPDMVVVGEATSGCQAVRRFREAKPDVTLMDLQLPDMSGIDAVIDIRSDFPEARLIILTTFAGDVEIQRALEAGARAYVLKSMPPSELLDAIRQVHAGKKKIPPEIAAYLAEHYSDERLTVREVDILRQLAGGNRNRDIAERLFIAEETVKAHLKHIMGKLGANDRTQAVAIGVRRGIIQL
jgi:DNA-binding NarL/FixJ family response regulator